MTTCNNFVRSNCSLLKELKVDVCQRFNCQLLFCLTFDFDFLWKCRLNFEFVNH